MKKRLLIIVSRLLQGGIDTVLVEYLKHFDRKKYQITLAIGIHMEELEKHICEIPHDISIKYLVQNHNLIRYRKRKITGRLSFYEKLYDEIILNPIRRYVQKSNLQKLLKGHDIVIDFDSTFYSFLDCCKIPKIAFFHFSFKRYHNGNPQKLIRLGRKMSVYDRIITPCHEMEKEGKELYPHLKDRFYTIYNSFNFETIREKAKEVIPIQKPYIIAVERLEETQKDITTLLKAYKILIQKYDIEEKLFIIGEGKSRKELEDLQRKLNLQEKACFMGFIQNPYPWIQKARLFVLSSKFEGFGNVLVEAMILNTPIVSTDCPTGPKEILANGKAGILTPVGNEEFLAEQIHQLLTNRHLREEIETQASQQVENFNVKHNIKMIEKLISQTQTKK